MDDFFEVTDRDEERFEQVFSDVLKQQGRIAIIWLFLAATMFVLWSILADHIFWEIGVAASLIFVFRLFYNHHRRNKLFKEWQEGKVPDRPYS